VANEKQTVRMKYVFLSSQRHSATRFDLTTRDLLIALLEFASREFASAERSLGRTDCDRVVEEDVAEFGLLLRDVCRCVGN